MNGDKSGSGIDSCLFPLAASFLPNIAELPDQMLDFSVFHPHCIKKIKKYIELSQTIKKCHKVKTYAGLRFSTQEL